jgi:hypothetical protein
VVFRNVKDYGAAGEWTAWLSITTGKVWDGIMLMKTAV